MKDILKGIIFLCFMIPMVLICPLLVLLMMLIPAPPKKDD